MGDGNPLGEFERLLAGQASIVVGLELMRERVVRETERRLAGDLLADALSGRLEADELAGRLRPFGECGIELQCKTSVVSYPDDGVEVAALFEALYRTTDPSSAPSPAARKAAGAL